MRKHIGFIHKKNPALNKLEELFSNSVFIAVVTIALLLAIPLTVYFAKQRQNTTSHASAASATMTFGQPITNPAIGQTIQIPVLLTASASVTGVDLTIQYDPAFFDFIDFQPTASFSDPLINNGGQGIVRIAEVDTSATGVFTSPVQLGTVSLRTKTPGNTTISYQNATIATLGSSELAQTNYTATAAITISNSGITPTDAILSVTPTSVPISETPAPTGNNHAPVVSDISASVQDLDPATPGLQIPVGSSVTYTASATDPDNDVLDWTWYYTINGGQRTPFRTGAGVIEPAPFTYGANPITYQWIISVSDGQTTTEKTLTVNTLATNTTITPGTTITQSPNSMQFSFTLNLPPHGPDGNTNPAHQQRDISVQVLDQTNTPVAVKLGTATYNPTTNKFTTTLDMGTVLPSGQYTIKVHVPGYLRKQVPGIQTLTAGSQKTFAELTLTPGDINDDNVLNILDYNLLASCYNAPTLTTTCQNADVDDNGKVDGIDYNYFIRSLSILQGD